MRPTHMRTMEKMSETATLSLWECIKTSAWGKRKLLVSNRGCTSFWMFVKVSLKKRMESIMAFIMCLFLVIECPGDVCD